MTQEIILNEVSGIEYLVLHVQFVLPFVMMNFLFNVKQVEN